MYSIKVATVLMALNFIAGSSCQYLEQPRLFNSWKVMGTNKLSPQQQQQQQKIFRFIDSGPRYQGIEIIQLTGQVKSGKMVNQQLKQSPVEVSQQEQIKIKAQPPAPISKRVGLPKPPTPVKSTRPKTPTKHLKTLLPVGLTSWHLGGIRDLNGKHWHLPAEVMDRLAVNDVDLKVDRPAGSLGPSLIPR